MTSIESLPHDIAGIPFFPPSPGFREWLLFAICGVILLLLVTRRKTPALESSGSLVKAVERAKELRSRVKDADPETLRAVAYDLSLLIRRVIESRCAMPAGELSMKEIIHSLTGKEDSRVRGMLEILLRLEPLKYRTSGIEAQELLALCSDTEQAFREATHG